MWSQQQSSSHTIDLKFTEIRNCFSSLFFWFYVRLRKPETQKIITLHTKISYFFMPCRNMANGSNTSLNIDRPEQSNNHLITRLNIFFIIWNTHHWYNVKCEWSTYDGNSQKCLAFYMRYLWNRFSRDLNMCSGPSKIHETWTHGLAVQE